MTQSQQKQTDITNFCIVEAMIRSKIMYKNIIGGHAPHCLRMIHDLLVAPDTQSPMNVF